MSNLLIEPIDDPVLDAGTNGFSGRNSRLRSALIQDSELSNSENCIIGETGMAQTRFPLKCIEDLNITSATAQGIFFYDTRTRERIIKATNYNLYSADGFVKPNWVNLSHTVAGEVKFAQLNDYMYFVDTQQLWKWDGASFTQITTFDSSATGLPGFSDIIVHDNRLLLSGITSTGYDDDEIYASDILDGDSIDITFSVRVGGGDGDPIRKILSWHGSYVAVLKQKSCYVINTSTAIGESGQGAADPVNWFIEKVTDTLGCIAANTVVAVGNDIWFLSREGLTSLVRTKESEQRQVSALVLNTPVNDVFEDINWDEAHKSCAGYFNNRFYISVPVSTSRVPNVTLVFNLLTQKWEGQHDGTAWMPMYYGKACFGNNKRLMIQDNTGNLYWQREEGGVYEGRDELPRTTQTSGTLNVGEAYEITDFNAGDNFTNVGASSNATGIQFIATGTTPTTYSNGSTLAKYRYEAIDYKIDSKAWDFGYPVNFKSGFNLEIDFYKSHGTVDIYLIPDDDESRILTVATAVDTTEYPELPEVLPFTLTGKNDKRLIFEVSAIEEFKELTVRIVGSGSEVKVRRIHLTSFLNTMEIDNT
jgi:hypothetical protein